MITSFSFRNTIESDMTLFSCYQFFQSIKICVSRAKEPDAGMYSNGIINFVTIIIMIIIVYKDIFCYQHREIIYNQTCKYLLYHAFFLFRMKSNQTNIVLQFSEIVFNSPTHFVEHFDIFDRKLIIPKIGNNCFVKTVRNPNS